jgi:hypothetical protein
MEEDKEQRGFRVTDRRRFSEAGESRSDEPGAGDEPAGPDAARPDPSAAGQPVADQPLHTGPAAPEEAVNFSTFVLGLSTQALLHLGEIPNPMTRALERDLPAAKQVIDILGILREKTRNNLDASEEGLLDSVLYDLRLRYVELARRQPKEGA